MADVNEMEVFDWEAEIEDDGEERVFVTLEAGKYPFEVTKFERGQYEAKPGGKAPSCKKAIIQILIRSEAGDCYITENFLLYKKMEWKMSQFFRSLGLKKSGEKMTTKWESTVGCTGMCEITKDKGNKEGTYFNHVKTWLEPEGDNEWS